MLMFLITLFNFLNFDLKFKFIVHNLLFINLDFLKGFVNILFIFLLNLLNF